MSSSVETMTLPCTNTTLLADAASAAAEREASMPPPASKKSSPPSTSRDENQSAGPSSSSKATAAVAAKSLAAETVNAATTYTTPRRVAGLAAVTPNTPGETTQDGAAVQQQQGEEGIVSADETSRESEAPMKKGAAVVARGTYSTARKVSGETAETPAAVAKPPSTTKKVSKAASISATTPSIKLGPRVTPSIVQSTTTTASSTSPTGVKEEGSPSTHSSDFPLRPRNLDGALKEGDNTLLSAAAAAAASVAAQQAAGATGAEVTKRECPNTPAVQNGPIPPPSSFLAAKISPLRSSRNNPGGGGAAAGITGGVLEKKGETAPPSPPAASSNNEPPTKLSPGMFLSPRTPKPLTQGDAAKSSSVSFRTGMTPGFTPGLTPTNFASDFGKGQREGGLTMDPNNVFAFLHSPGGQGLFSPEGGLNSLSATPRGMYGFTGPPGSTSKMPGQAGSRLAPSPPKSATHPSHYLSGLGLVAGGDAGVNTPKVPGNQRSMICISPLASKNSGKNRNGVGGEGGAPDTPMSIDFNEVFASPRLPTPRLNSGSSRKESDGKVPVMSALHTAERDVNIDDDLNALLQLAGAATPGSGRPMTFMSPLLTNSLRRVAHMNTEPPSSLQLPIISGNSTGEAGTKNFRDSPPAVGGFSPPNLAIRSTSSGSPVKSSLKKSKKRKSPANVGSPDHPPAGYNHPSMMHYRHPHAAAPAHHGYYHHPGYPANSHHGHLHHMSYPSVPHPAPQQHYAYSASPPKAASPIKLKASPAPIPEKRGRGRPRSSSAPKSKKAATKTKPPAKPKPPRAMATIATTKYDVVKSRPRERPSRPPPAPRGPVPSTPVKRVRKAAAKATSKLAKTATISTPDEKQRISAAIHAVNRQYGTGAQKEKKLAAATLRGVTMRPSGKWQAQLYYAGKSRYIGVFDNKERASLAYEIAREVLKGDEGPSNAGETEKNVNLARKAAFAGVNEHTGQ